MTAAGVPETRRRAETRRRLMAAAQEVFSEYGIAEAPIEVICERAGFTRGAFYSNFASKEALFLAVFADQMSERLATVRGAFEHLVLTHPVRDEAGVRTLITSITTLYLKPLVADARWYALTVEIRAMALRDPELRVLADATFSAVFDELAALLDGMTDHVGVRLTVRPRYAAVVLCALYEAALERSIFEGGTEPFESPLVLNVLPQLVSRALIDFA